MAEHMMVIGVENPRRENSLCQREPFPSGCAENQSRDARATEKSYPGYKCMDRR